LGDKEREEEGEEKRGVGQEGRTSVGHYSEGHPKSHLFLNIIL